MNGAELLLANAAGEVTALQCGEQTVSYASLRERVARAAAVWREQGVKPGQPVAVMLPDGIDWVIAWLGALWAGAVAVGVNPRIPADEWRATLAAANFAQVLAEDESTTPAPWTSRVLPLALARALWRNATPLAAEPRLPGDVAFWVHSSGTSGQPKAVVHAHGDLREVARTSTERLSMAAGDRLYSSSRLFFTYPLANVLLAGLRVGATVLLDPQWPTPLGLVACVQRMRPTMLFTVPSMLRALLHEGLADELRGLPLRQVVSAGEVLPPPLRERWQQETGIALSDGYGTSETLVLVMTAGDDGALRASPGVSLQAVDEAAAAQGQPTQLQIRCPTLAVAYHGQGGRPFAGRQFTPADQFVRQGEGWRFAGREDSLVKQRGRWVDLVALEEQLASGVSGLREAALASVDDDEGLPALALFYVADDPVAVGHELQQRIAALPPHQRAASVHALAALPRTATGKLLRRKLREWLLGPPREAAGDAPGTTQA